MNHKARGTNILYGKHDKCLRWEVCFNLINILFQAKEEALHELRNAHPNQEISLHLPDHCSEHLEKINQV